MAATAVYSCGCSITRSMYGKRETLSIDPCQKHLISLTGKTMEQLEQDIVEIQNNDQHDGGGSFCMCNLCQEVRKQLITN